MLSTASSPARRRSSVPGWPASSPASRRRRLAGHSRRLAVAAKPRQALTVLYASESGNAEALAMRTKKLAQKHGLDAKVVDFADADLARAVEGQEPDRVRLDLGRGRSAGPRRRFLHRADGPRWRPRIEGVRFAVLALGDTAYAQFCATGKAIDERLEALGGKRAFDRVDLDLDYSKQAAEWTEKALGELAPAEAAGTATVVHVDFKGGAAARRRRRAAVHRREPARRRDRDAGQPQRQRARRARPGTSRSPPRRPASPICPAMPSASCRRTIPTSRWSWPRPSASVPTAPSCRSCASATT